MQLSKEHFKLMKQCIGLKFKVLSHKFIAKKNKCFVSDCNLEQLKLWNDLCKLGYAKYCFSEKTQYYFLTEKGIRFLELKYSIQISISGESYGRN